MEENMNVLLGMVFGFVYASFLEWFIHKYLYHKVGKNKNSIFSYHLKEHHVIARKNNFIDQKSSLVETVGLFLLVAIHLPLMFINIGAFISVMLYAVAFSILHSKQHKDPEFTKKYFKWHWEHHMKNPNKNFGVVTCWIDYLLKTRKNYKEE